VGVRRGRAWRDGGRIRQSLTALLDGLLAAWVVGVGPVCWALRDGLGPDAVDSHGPGAVARFLMTFWWGPILAALLLTRLAVRRCCPGRPSPRP
jgi:hypothetical protein